ncbi:hypothetical protein BsWGS_28588 [Bradybaena similaris]
MHPGSSHVFPPRPHTHTHKHTQPPPPPPSVLLPGRFHEFPSKHPVFYDLQPCPPQCKSTPFHDFTCCDVASGHCHSRMFKCSTALAQSCPHFNKVRILHFEIIDLSSISCS